MTHGSKICSFEQQNEQSAQNAAQMSSKLSRALNAVFLNS